MASRAVQDHPDEPESESEPEDEDEDEAKWVKTFTFGALPGETLTVHIPEVLDPSYGMYVWPCAPVLAQYLWYNRHQLKGKKVLELGAGTALPGVVAAKLGADVTLSDAGHLPQCVENCTKSCRANQLPDIKAIEITWGLFEPDLLELEPQDIVLGSDCFYAKKDFENILVTVAYLMEQNPDCEFWTTYQIRSADRCIIPLLMRWGLEGKQVPLDSFDADSDSLAGSSLPGIHTIEMYIIRKSSE